MGTLYVYQRSIQEMSILYVPMKYRRRFYYGFKEVSLMVVLVLKMYPRGFYTFQRLIQEGSIGFKDVFERDLMVKNKYLSVL